MMLTFVIFILLAASQLSADGYLDKLAKDLTSKDVSLVYPGGKVTVSIGMSLIDLRFDPKTEVLTTQLWERYAWNDSRLAWKAEQYNGIDEIRLPSKLIWTPDVVLYNEASDHHHPARHDSNAVIKSDGSVLWMPAMEYKSMCYIFRRDNDSIECKLKFGSWTYDGANLELKAEQNELDIDSFSPSSYLDLQTTKVKVNVLYYQGLDAPYLDFMVSIGFKMLTGWNSGREKNPFELI